jgi:hypothetical protein
VCFGLLVFVDDLVAPDLVAPPFELLLSSSFLPVGVAVGLEVCTGVSSAGVLLGVAVCFALLVASKRQQCSFCFYHMSFALTSRCFIIILPYHQGI